MDPIVTIVIVVVAAVLVGTIAFFMGIKYRKKVGEAQIGAAEVLLEAKEEAMKVKNDLEQEVRERRAEVQRQEKRVVQKEEVLDRKVEGLERKENQLSRKMEELDRKNKEISKFHEQQLQELERISGLTSDQAKDILLQSVEEDVKHDMAVMLKEAETKTKEEATKKAREILTSAIQRCAADHVAETTVSVVPLPSDEMKGRRIGREGRNIRAVDQAPGIAEIID